ncbi:MAG TPA: Gfo/Idh/MocA family oxidoreductase, partial [Luteolibacter sp.]|nr:Gfo/Idh/MocA family oxidoreductase [Luteolibacter sp.]
GTGTIARVHAVAIAAMQGGILHSIYGRNGEAARNLAAAHGIRAFDDIEAFLTDPELDVVTICTPSGAHREPALAALRHGKHVICEKPLEVTTARVDGMIEAASAAGKVLASVLNRRFTPAMDAFWNAVSAGRFGRLTSASCHVKWFRDQAYYDSAAWRGTWALDGGGALMNQGIHAVDALLHLAGPVRAVRADIACLAHEGIEVEDIAVAIMEFENGARGVIEAATCCASQTGHPVRIQLCGTGGSVFLADESFEVWDFLAHCNEDHRIRAELMADGKPGLGANDPAAIQSLQHQRNFEEVVRAIREGREPSTSAREARKAVAVIEAIYHSAGNGGARVEPAPITAC